MFQKLVVRPAPAGRHEPVTHFQRLGRIARNHAVAWQPTPGPTRTIPFGRLGMTFEQPFNFQHRNQPPMRRKILIRVPASEINHAVADPESR